MNPLFLCPSCALSQVKVKPKDAFHEDEQLPPRTEQTIVSHLAAGRLEIVLRICNRKGGD